jgi:natural product precursor
MKKLNRKLTLKKETIVSLDKSEMASVKGGFTYSLSTGARCKSSKSAGASNPFECGAVTEAMIQEACE